MSASFTHKYQLPKHNMKLREYHNVTIIYDNEELLLQVRIISPISLHIKNSPELKSFIFSHFFPERHPDVIKFMMLYQHNEYIPILSLYYYAIHFRSMMTSENLQKMYDFFRTIYDRNILTTCKLNQIEHDEDTFNMLIQNEFWNYPLHETWNDMYHDLRKYYDIQHIDFYEQEKTHDDLLKSLSHLSI